ncbi:MAG: hypothetical protein PHN45_00085 [Methylococcales bacterium]|nr:hypothetical protein [Methylococcales bacterium]
MDTLEQVRFIIFNGTDEYLMQTGWDDADIKCDNCEKTYKARKDIYVRIAVAEEDEGSKDAHVEFKETHLCGMECFYAHVRKMQEKSAPAVVAKEPVEMTETEKDKVIDAKLENMTKSKDIFELIKNYSDGDESSSSSSSEGEKETRTKDKEPKKEEEEDGELKRKKEDEPKQAVQEPVGSTATPSDPGKHRERHHEHDRSRGSSSYHGNRDRYGDRHENDQMRRYYRNDDFRGRGRSSYMPRRDYSWRPNEYRGYYGGDDRYSSARESQQLVSKCMNNID